MRWPILHAGKPSLTRRPIVDAEAAAQRSLAALRAEKEAANEKRRRFLAALRPLQESQNAVLEAVWQAERLLARAAVTDVDTWLHAARLEAPALRGPADLMIGSGVLVCNTLPFLFFLFLR